MTSQSTTIPAGTTPKDPLWLQTAFWITICLLLALVQIPWARYQFGVGNQGIQIAFLEALHNPELFSNDTMVNKTLTSYPSFFFHLVARLLSLKIFDVPTLYLFLHIIATAGVFAAVAGLAKAVTRSTWAALVCLLFLVAGHHQALAGETLYSPGFTHTWAIFPLSLLALLLFFRNRYLMAFLVAGVIFNFHALEAGHLLLIMGFAAVIDLRRVGFRNLVLATLLFFAAAAPTLIVMARQHQPFDISPTATLGIKVSDAAAGPRIDSIYPDSAAAAVSLAPGDILTKIDGAPLKNAQDLATQLSKRFTGDTVTLDLLRDGKSLQLKPVLDPSWLQLMHIRSADHSFPSSWWEQGDPGLPRFLCILGLAAVALGFRLPQTVQKRTLLLAAGIGILFLAGWLFTDIIPIPIFIRAQLFRSSRLLFILALIVIAHGCIRSWQLLFQRPRTVPLFTALLESFSALFTALCIAVPSMMLLLPFALLLSLLAALASGRLAWYETLAAAAVLLVCFLAWQTIGFVIPGLTPVPIQMLLDNRTPGAAGWSLLALAIVLGILAARRSPRALSIPAFAAGALVAIISLVLLFPAILHGADTDPAWSDVQHWAKNNSPPGTIFLTDAHVNDKGRSSFRIYSERAVVGEWRDGTQLYFNAAFANEWWDRMNKLQPDIATDASGAIRNPGKSLATLDDEVLVKLAHDYKADYLVLPHSDRCLLEKVYDNGTWSIRKPKLQEFAGPSPDAALGDEDKFIRTVALPNIERNRKGDARIAVVDAAGKPVPNLQFTAAQISSPFGFGASLGFFKQPKIDTRADYLPPEVVKDELARFLESFNYSVIAFSSQWRFLEPDEGRVDYTDLDRYVEWCAQNSVRPEFRFVTGYQPAWLKGKLASDQVKYILPHAQALAQRYGTKIADWQVISEDPGDARSIATAVAVFTELRKLMPAARLGVSDDARFWSIRPGAQGQDDMYRGLDVLHALKSKGITPDFFAFEAKHPDGLWAGGKQSYEVLDAFAKEGVKIHITEFGVAVGDRIEGAVREGTWTPQLQADYYERFFTMCFSHPAVEAVNIMAMGPHTWIDNQGLLDEKLQPTPALLRLNDLITKRWRTHASDKSGADGIIAFRGFHGTYTLSITTPAGKTITTPLTIEPDKDNAFRFTLSADAGTLTRSEGH